MNLTNKKFTSIRYAKIIIGANFCQVIRINPLIHIMFSITFGNQKWKGAAPIFNIRVNTINLIGILLIMSELRVIKYIVLNRIIFIIIENKIIVEAKACTRK